MFAKMFNRNHHKPSVIASPKIWRAKMFDFKRITLFCLEKRLSKHKMTFSKNFGGAMVPLPPPLVTPMHIAVSTSHGCSQDFFQERFNWSCSNLRGNFGYLFMVSAIKLLSSQYRQWMLKWTKSYQQDCLYSLHKPHLISRGCPRHGPQHF